MISISRLATSALIAAGAGLFVADLSAQTSKDILFYRFVRGTGKIVTNFAAGGPRTATINGTVTSQWTTGKTDRALRGASNTSPQTLNWVDTTWKGAIKGDFTAAWFMKQENSPAATLSYVYSGVGSFRCFTNGVAGKGLWTRAWGGAPADLKMTTDVQALASAKWTHVALVVDWTGTKTATYYVNGAPEAPIKLTAGANVAAAGAFRVGMHTSGSFGWTYNTDNFRFSLRAASPAEIKSWSELTPAADNVYNVAVACKSALGSKNGPPSLGNSKYQLTVSNSSVAAYALSIGASRTLLAFDLGVVWPSAKGCMWGSSLDIVGGGSTAAPLNLPIPNNASLKGANLWCQAAVLGAAPHGSNGLNILLN